MYKIATELLKIAKELSVTDKVVSVKSQRKRLAIELIKLAKEINSFWKMEVVPPSKHDVLQATATVQGALATSDPDMNNSVVDFRRYLVFQDNAVTNPESARNSNKFLVIAVLQNKKTGKYGAGCAGGRMGEHNRPKLYQNWGVSNDVSSLQRQFEPYIRKKTSGGGGRDAYVELPENEVM